MNILMGKPTNILIMMEITIIMNIVMRKPINILIMMEIARAMNIVTKSMFIIKRIIIETLRI